MRTTIRDVAKHAGVSVATVSRYLNNSPLIAAESVERVKLSIQVLHYEPSFMARNMLSQHSNTIALVMDSSDPETFGNEQFLKIQYGMEQALAKHGYYLLVINLGSVGREKALQKIVREKRVDGLIFPAQLAKKSIRSFLNENNIPYIVFGRGASDTYNWLDLDNVMGGRIATEKLIRTGSRHIAFVGNGLEKVFVQERLLGYKQALKACGMVPESIPNVQLPSSAASGEDYIHNLVQDIDGLIVSDDITAFGMLRALRARQINVPEHVQMITFDNRVTTQLSDPPLSVVDIDVFNLGIQAASMLFTQLQAPTAISQQCLMPVHLIERGTTR